jgi:hypothetical protein
MLGFRLGHATTVCLPPANVAERRVPDRPKALQRLTGPGAVSLPLDDEFLHQHHAHEREDLHAIVSEGLVCKRSLLPLLSLSRLARVICKGQLKS